MRLLAGIAVLAAFVVIVAAVVIASGATEPDRSRCVAVKQETLDYISAGILPETGATLANGWAVKSEAFANVWFVAAELHAPGLGDSGRVALWGTDALTRDGEPASSGVVLSIDGFAHQFTDWRHGQDHAAHLTRDTDGASEALACVTG